MKGSFTCVDLVNVYAKRCYIYGRELHITADENIEEALKEAEVKDRELQEAIKNGSAL